MLVGWFWFLAMLAPVSGLVVIGDQAIADRYTYLSYTGLFIVLVWGAAELLGSRERGEEEQGSRGEGEKGRKGEGSNARRWAWTVAGLVLAFFAAQHPADRVLAGQRLLFRHALDAVPNAYMARTNLAGVLADEGKAAEAGRGTPARPWLSSRATLPLTGLGAH